MGWVDFFVSGALLLTAVAAGALVVGAKRQPAGHAGAAERRARDTDAAMRGTPSGGEGRVKTAPDGWIDPLKFDAEKAAATPLVRGNAVSRGLKRSSDIAMAVLLLIFTLPLMVVAAIAVKIDSPGPIFYRQTRVGRDGKVFRITKFRTMRTDAEASGPQWASKGDARITTVGSFLRRSRIDEIPQAFNILAGNMSFVGPRPERPEFTEKLAEEIPNFHARTLVKPGLTGWAQVNLPYAASINDTRLKLAYDLYYIEKQSVFLDLWIVLKTFKVALFSDSAH